MNKFQIEYPPELQKDIEQIKKDLIAIKENKNPSEPDDLMTRQQVADKLHVDLSTVHNLTVKGILKKWGVGGRVYYKRSEIDSAIIKL